MDRLQQEEGKTSGPEGGERFLLQPLHFNSL